MKILHTSDWHIGRTFHGSSTLDHLGTVLDALVQIVREHDVDVVLVSGDVFDSATPARENYDLLATALRNLRNAGAEVVMISGNHDSATRLGFQSEWLGLAGIHIITRHDQHDQPVTISDGHGAVNFYGIPYLEPSLIRHHYPDAQLRRQADVLGFAMDRVRSEIASRGGRSVVLSHCFVVGLEASDVERDITAGGLDYVPANVFDGPHYVALGHIHGRNIINERVRYSGAPLHYSFKEAGKPRGVWLIELGAQGVDVTEWVDLPVPRQLTVLTGEVETLLTDDSLAGHENDWVCAVLTDQVRPLDGMRRIQQRFPHCVTLEYRPNERAENLGSSYADRVAGKTDHEIVADFLKHVRNGAGPSDFERDLIAEVIIEQATAEATA
ncbi:MAG: exonuclease sbcCD subunit [Homoserinimonas sp.]|jgi:exonuclease SbcD|nr:exonuclease sbcCD subunit [Homoserinimonas sp.]